jgi:hypothetical protein
MTPPATPLTASRRSFSEVLASFQPRLDKALADVRSKERELSIAGLKIETPFDPTFGIPRSKKLHDKNGRAYPALDTQRRACLSEISRLDGLLTDHRSRQANARTAAAVVARNKPTPTPPKSRREIADGLWATYRTLSPTAKNDFYREHRAAMD